MAHITIVDPASATGELADLYTRIASARGGVADVHQVQSLNPRAMAAHLDLYRAILFQVILTVGYFNFVNRLVLATGLALEANYTDTCKPT